MRPHDLLARMPPGRRFITMLALLVTAAMLPFVALPLKGSSSLYRRTSRRELFASGAL